MKLKSITDLPQLAGKRVLLRSELNIPLENGEIRDAYRFEQALPTIKFLVEAGARVILVAHIGREPDETLHPIFKKLAEHVPVTWAGGVTGPGVAARARALQNGQVLMLENVRQDARETENDRAFAKELAALAEVFVNDAFAATHRAHASTAGVAEFLPAYAGLNMEAEVRSLNGVMQPAHPAFLVLGGAKFETKQPLVEQYLDLYDHIFIAGALANDFFKARGFEVGESLVGDIPVPDSLINHPKILIPVDVVVETASGERKTVDLAEVQPGDKIYDAGPATIAMLKPIVDAAKTVLWNGPLGNYEAGFSEGTEALAALIAASDTHSVVGGGDTVAAIQKLNLHDKFGFVSTGGGAMLTLLEEGTTPVLELLKA